jgi:CHAT domain-containing protein
MRDRQLIVIHDARSSRIPWETLKIEDWSPAAGVGLSRKYEAEDLTVAKWLEDRRLADELSVLLIVNPTKDLPGAEKEGQRIKNILAQDPAVRLEELWREEATFSAVRAAFRSGKYDVVHYAGHAFFDAVNRARSGILCHGGQVLSGMDLAYLEKLPALVFFNACEAGRVRSAKDRARGKGTAKRLETNMGLAEAFLRAGVGNYIGTYWPVGDNPAKAFGGAFYLSIVRGETVGMALNAARNKVRALESVDWADYIHYGSPSFLVKRRA